MREAKTIRLGANHGKKHCTYTIIAKSEQRAQKVTKGLQKCYKTDTTKVRCALGTVTIQYNLELLFLSKNIGDFLGFFQFS